MASPFFFWPFFLRGIVSVLWEERRVPLSFTLAGAALKHEETTMRISRLEMRMSRRLRAELLLQEQMLL